ncbi:MAG: electron transport complex subunit E [Bacteroidales bacterium]|jgi:electron transport complex protein RnfE|nr:electron transport complex subunit E [Bacteroidales bacterium]MDD2571066.1 electron transport complex subunit E [Bacteroidales bacterium]MDD2812409.1 electron transport complex subunit E [Bacteroidales bacterium]MDD3384748.1 electron transport complex subunit E [Bacteroidales bacterium]MDD3812330.1 electron transport complex subunit E [Bacteroidales bacterium]
MSRIKLFTNGIIRENPVLVLLIGLCPTLAVSTSAINGLGMGAATTFVLTMSNIVISSIKNVVPSKVRIPIFIVVIAGFVTIVQMTMEAFVPALYEALGVFVPLIVVNCIILARAEAFAQKNTVLNSIIDGLGMGIGFTLAITLLGSIREILGNGSIFGQRLVSADANTILVFILSPGAFIALGYIIAVFNQLRKAK